MRAAILLAAGGSRRFGRGDKLLAPLGGRPLVLYALDRAREAGAHRVIAVIPSTGGRVGRLLARQPGLHLVRAIRHRDGLGASLAAGLAALRPVEREALVFLADMPFARAPRRMRIPRSCDSARPQVGGKPGHPLLVRTEAACRLALCGDRGLAGQLDRTAAVAGAAGNLLDIDTREALRRARLQRIARIGVALRERG